MRTNAHVFLACFVLWSVTCAPGPGSGVVAAVTSVRPLQSPPDSSDAVVINELMASNSATLADAEGEYDDWIELYNVGAAPVYIGGMYLTDDLSVPTKWRIGVGDPAVTTIPAHGYQLVWADGDVEQGALHTSFELDADGDGIALFAADGETLIDSVTFGPRRTDVSFGRLADGDTQWRDMMAATPGRANGPAYDGAVAEVAFSRGRGFYTDSFTLALATSTPGATILYTLDGSPPTGGRVQPYRDPIPIETTTVVRAIAYKDRFLATKVATHTYIFLADVIRQHADVPGYPRPWTWLGGSGYAYHDYEMDPDVVNAPAYRDTIVDALRDIPTLALAAAQEDMDTFYWGSGEKCISIELIHPGQPDKNVQTDCGAEPHSHNRMKRSLRLNFRAEFGDARLKSSLLRDAPLNGETADDTFDKLILRGGNNRCWARVWNPERTTYTMDQWYRDTQIAMSGVGSRGTFVHLYINGLYWGLYNVVERPDAAFGASYLGGEAEDWYSVSHGGSHGGDPGRWNYLKGALKNKDMSDPANYAEMRQYLDIDNFIDYVMLSWFVGLSDWPQNNWWGGNRNDVPGPFFYFGWDAEWSWKTTRGHNNGWVHPDFRQNKSGGATIAALWHALRRNADFMMRFADRAYAHLFNDGVLTDDNCQVRYLTLNDFVRDAVVAESARWGDTCEGLGHPTRTRDVDWVFAEAETLGPGFMEGNAARFLASLRGQGYYPDIDPPVLVPRGGHVPSDFTLEMVNPNAGGAIYYTLDGSDPRRGAPSVSQDSVTLVAADADKSVRVPTSPVDAAWQGGSPFDDSAWIEVVGAPGGIGYETKSGYEAFISLDLERRMYEHNAGCYIRIPFVGPQGLGGLSVLTLRVRYDDGFVAYLNGVEICRVNVTGQPAWDTLASGSHADGQAVVFESFDVSDHLDLLAPGENVLALHALNSSLDSSDLLISAELVAAERSATETGVAPTALRYEGPAVLTASGPVRARVLDGDAWSALEQATFAVGPVAEDLRIAEIMYHPRDPNAEYIELKNVGAETLNLNLVAFTRGIRFVFGDGVLAAGDCVLVVKDAVAFEQCYGDGHNIAGRYAGSLDNGGERIRLVDAVGHVIHDFKYDDDWYPATDGDGFSLTVIDPAGADTNDWGEKRTWRASRDVGGSPGADD